MYRRIIFTGVLLILGLSLGGCDGESKSDQSASTKKANQVKKGPLLKVGQYSKDEKGKIRTLMAITFPKDNIDLNPVKASIKNVKILKNEKANKEEEASWYHINSNDIPDVYYTVQVTYVLTNTSDKDITISGLDSITTNTGQQMDNKKGLYDEGSSSSLNGKVTREYFALGYLGSDFKISTINLKFGPFYDTTPLKLMTEKSKNIEIKIKNNS